MFIFECKCCPKGHIGTQIEYKSQRYGYIYESSIVLNARWPRTDEPATCKWLPCLTALQGKFFTFKVFPVWWRSLSGDLLCAGLQLHCLRAYLVVSYLIGKDQIISLPFLFQRTAVLGLWVSVHWWGLYDLSPTLLLLPGICFGGVWRFWGIYSLFGWYIRGLVSPTSYIRVRRHVNDVEKCSTPLT